MASTLLQYDASSFIGDVVPVTASDLAAFPDMINGRDVIAFPDGSDEYAAVSKAVEVPANYAGGTLTARIHYFTAATANERR